MGHTDKSPARTAWDAVLAKHALPEARMELRLKKKSEQIRELEAQLDAALDVISQQTCTITGLLRRVRAPGCESE